MFGWIVSRLYAQILQIPSQAETSRGPGPDRTGPDRTGPDRTGQLSQDFFKTFLGLFQDILGTFSEFL